MQPQTATPSVAHADFILIHMPPRSTHEDVQNVYTQCRALGIRALVVMSDTEVKLVDHAPPAPVVVNYDEIVKHVLGALDKEQTFWHAMADRVFQRVIHFLKSTPAKAIANDSTKQK